MMKKFLIVNVFGVLCVLWYYVVFHSADAETKKGLIYDQTYHQTR